MKLFIILWFICIGVLVVCLTLLEYQKAEIESRAAPACNCNCYPANAAPSPVLGTGLIEAHF